MSDYKTELIAIIAAAVTGLIGWVFGGRQKAKADKTDSITKGTDKIVDTSTKLLEKLETMLDEARKREADAIKREKEAKEREDKCERAIAQLRRDFEAFKAKCKYNCFDGKES